jgi:hypothetical protein
MYTQGTMVCARNINISGFCACGKKLAVLMEAGAFDTPHPLLQKEPGYRFNNTANCAGFYRQCHKGYGLSESRNCIEAPG